MEIGDHWPLNHQRKSLRWAACSQVVPFTMWDRLIERQSALVNRIDFFSLRRMPDTAGQCQVSIATRLRENLHLRIDTAKAAVGGVREGEIAVDETVARNLRAGFGGKTAMAKGQAVAEFQQHAASVFCCIGARRSMVQVDLYFSP